MKDFLGNELNIGDEVVFITPGYRDYTKGKILYFTSQFVRIESDKIHKKGIKQTPNQLIKIIK